jgi:triacylglycerol lipase
MMRLRREGDGTDGANVREGEGGGMSSASPGIAGPAGMRCAARPAVARAWRPLLEERRTLVAARALLRHPVWRGAAVPRGDGLPVLLIPGYEALPEHLSLGFLSRWLNRIGYLSYRSKVRLEADRNQGAVDRLERRLRLLAESARRPVALIGHGGGGELARSLAVRRPDLVAGVISLGSPDMEKSSQRRSRQRIREPSWSQSQKPAQDGTQPFPADVPFTAIYPRGDGVVPWDSCVDAAAERVEVKCSQLGMAVHPAVYRLVAERLALMGGKEIRTPSAGGSEPHG